MDIRPFNYDRVNLLFDKHFAYHDVEFERSNGVPEETLAKMKKQNAMTEKAYLADAKKRNAILKQGW